MRPHLYDEAKNLDALDIPLPRLTRRYQREFKNLSALDPSAFGNRTLPLKPFMPEEAVCIFQRTLTVAFNEFDTSMNLRVCRFRTCGPTSRK